MTLQEAASLSGKAEQTIRRAIKAKKIAVRKNKTVQGFNYLVDKASLFELYSREDAQTGAKKPKAISQTPGRPTSRPIYKGAAKKTIVRTTSQTPGQKRSGKERGGIDMEETVVERGAIMEFQKLLRNLVEEHQREREHSVRFLCELQDKVLFLEHQVMQLQAPKRKWWKFWR